MNQQQLNNLLVSQLITSLQQTQAAKPEPVQETSTAKEIIEQEGLQHPKDSLSFLKYYKAHVEKVQQHQQSLKRVSNTFVFIGAFAFAAAIYCFMNMKPQAATQHRLKQANDASVDGSVDISQMANMVSMMIWGLVLTKARAGLEAVESNDTSKVGGLLSRAVSLIVLIGAAAIFKLVSTVSQAPEAIAVRATPVLKQSHVQEYPESYYDETSSHYLGGAHNVALEQLKAGNIPQKYSTENGLPQAWTRGVEVVGGNHNIALQQLKAESMRRVQQQQGNSYMKLLGSIYKAQSSQKLTQEQFEQNVTRVGEFVAFIACGALCIAFYVSFRTYHASLQKLDKLTELFNNPKARVASGEQGQRIMKKLQQTKTPKVQEKADSASELN